MTGAPPPDAVRATTEAILKDARFAPQSSFWQWFTGLFSASRPPELAHLGLWGELILWGVLLWAVLTLLAIAGHVIWSIRAATRRPTITSAAPDLVPVVPPSAELLERRARERAGAGAHREAVTQLMLALLERLQRARLIATQEGKTNGDYLREISRTSPVAAAFARFSTLADVCLYGALPVGDPEFQRLVEIYEEVKGRVRRQA